MIKTAPKQSLLPLPDIGVARPFRTADKPFAVIDIGSNSVRFVAYGGSARSPLPIFNEKKFCRLGESVIKTGGISGPYWDDAMATFRRFKGVSERLGVTQIIVVATAAVRQAMNKNEFIKAAEKILKTQAAVISGEEEARFAALGVMMAFHKVDGLVADLGGGSLELARVVKGDIKEVATLPIGVLALATRFKFSKQQIMAHVDEALDLVDWLKKTKGKPIYIVGGTWRSLAEVEMHRRNSELRVLHHYKMPAKAIAPFLNEFAAKTRADLRKFKQVNVNRRFYLANAAIILRNLLLRSGCNIALVSAAGLREGIIYHALDEAMKKQDQLLAACTEMAQRLCKDAEYGEELIAWTENLFQGTQMSPRKAESFERLRQAVCLLGDVAWSQHLDFRGLIAAETVLHAPFTGISHAGRCFLANAFLFKHNSSSSYAPMHAPRGFIPMRDKARKLSSALGLSLQLGDSLSGSISGMLVKTQLYQKNGTLILEVPQKYENLISERIDKKLSKVANMLNLNSKITIKKKA